MCWEGSENRVLTFTKTAFVGMEVVIVLALINTAHVRFWVCVEGGGNVGKWWIPSACFNKYRVYGSTRFPPPFIHTQY